MKQAAIDVALFHAATDTPVWTVPAFPADERIDLRQDLFVEEGVKEFIPALARRDMVATADAIIDTIYVLVGRGPRAGSPAGSAVDRSAAREHG